MTYILAKYANRQQNIDQLLGLETEETKVAKKQRGYIISDKAPAEDGSRDIDVPRYLSKQEFARRLYTLRNEKGWHNAELGRRAGLARNNITSYLKGYTYPSEISLQKLARAFGMAPEDLLPNRTKEAIQDEETPDMSLKSSVADPGMSWLVVNRRVSTSIGAQIVSLLEQDRVSAEQK